MKKIKAYTNFFLVISLLGILTSQSLTYTNGSNLLGLEYIPSFNSDEKSNLTLSTVKYLQENYLQSTREKSIQKVDSDNNRIADDLEQLLKTSNLKLNELYKSENLLDVIILTNSHEFESDLDLFESLGALTTRVWDNGNNYLTGFNGKISTSNLEKFSTQMSDKVILIELNKENQRLSDVSTVLTRVRTDVWDNLGFTGDPNMSIAILDTGIDDSHSAFNPGYGDLNWSKKIVGWYDSTEDASTTPEDFDGHGSHVAGIAGSIETNNTYDNGRIKSTYSLVYQGSNVDGFLDFYIDIDRLGTIDINYIWEKIAGTESAIGTELILLDKNGVQVASDNSGSANMSLTHEVTDSNQFGRWNVVFGLDLASGNDKTLAISISSKYPRAEPTDGHARFSGVAPDIKLVGVKIFDNSGSGTSADAIDAFNWVKNNKEIYHITIASGSFGFPSTVASVDVAAADLVNSGVLVVIAAGNDGQGTNNIFSPAQVDGVITVAASDDTNSITSYSSEGPGDTSSSVKPDIAAPGGSFDEGGILQVDSNDADADGALPDQLANDFTNIQGTSMAAPFVSGAAALLIEALGGYASWSYGSNSLPYKVKQLLLMTANEIYNENRGGKNKVEGYGRINVYAAIEAGIMNYTYGEVVNDTLGNEGDLRKVWARSVDLTLGSDYTYFLDVPTGSDFDFFLYGINPNTYGEPVIRASSTVASTGNTETITFSPTISGTYYLVVKVAYSNTQAGTFLLYTPTSGDFRAPELDSPNDISYIFSSTGNTIIWSVSDANPGIYSVTKNTSEYVENTSWINGSVFVNVDGLSVGIYEFTIVLSDSNFNTKLDSVIVVVSESDQNISSDQTTSTPNSSTSSNPNSQTAPALFVSILPFPIVVLATISLVWIKRKSK